MSDITFTDGAGALQPAWLTAGTHTLGVTVPASYSTIIVVAQVEATTAFDALSFRGDYVDFAEIVAISSEGASVMAWYMHSNHANAPTAGAKTLTFSFGAELQSTGGYIHCFFLDNTDTSITSFDTDTGTTTNWTSDDLTVASDGMSFISVLNYGASITVGGGGQSEIFNASQGYVHAAAYELAEDTPGATFSASYAAAISFAIAAAAGGVTIEINVNDTVTITENLNTRHKQLNIDVNDTVTVGEALD